MKVLHVSCQGHSQAQAETTYALNACVLAYLRLGESHESAVFSLAPVMLYKNNKFDH